MKGPSVEGPVPMPSGDPCWYCMGYDGDGAAYDPRVHLGWDCEACDERRELERLRAEVANVRATLDRQTNYAGALQRLIEALEDGATFEPSGTLAPWHHAKAVKVRARETALVEAMRGASGTVMAQAAAMALAHRHTFRRDEREYLDRDFCMDVVGKLRDAALNLNRAALAPEEGR